MTCINCQTEVSSKYCPQCGQPCPPKKITFGHMWVDFQARIYGFDGMFPRTLKDLTLHPGRASKNFISGNRVLYYGPVGYFFLMATVFLLIMGMMDLNVMDFLKATGKYGMQESLNPGASQNKFSQEVLRFASDNMKLISFAVIPFQVFCFRYLYFRESGFNYLENSVLPFYVQGHLYWISIFSAVYFKITGNFFDPIVTMVIALGFFSYATADFYDYQSKLKGFFKGLAVYFTSQILFIILIAILVVTLAYVSPDFYELIKPSNNH